MEWVLKQSHEGNPITTERYIKADWVCASVCLCMVCGVWCAVCGCGACVMWCMCGVRCSPRAQQKVMYLSVVVGFLHDLCLYRSLLAFLRSRVQSSSPSSSVPTPSPSPVPSPIIAQAAPKPTTAQVLSSLVFFCSFLFFSSCLHLSFFFHALSFC